MLQNNTWLTIDLDAFGEDGAAGGTAAVAGQQAESSGEVAAPEDLDAEFDQLIKTKYKDQYSRRVSDTVKARLRSSKEKTDRYDKALPVLERVAESYGIPDANDYDSMIKAFDEDKHFLEDEALERGVSIEEMQRIKRIERENKQLKAEMDRKQAEEDTRKQYAEWFEQAEACKQQYPSFDLETELQDPNFRSLLSAGVNVETAFKVVHQDELIPAAMQVAMKKGTERAANAVIANGMRPPENGSSAQAGTLSKIDVSTLTKAQIDELNMRAMRGERITF